MKVLVACEFSGIVRDAFLEAGHDAWSCDLRETESDGPHIRGDVLEILDEGWDLMVAHPPCTYLCVSGSRWLYDEDKIPERWQNMIDGAVFFRELLEASIPYVAVENPVMHKWARRIIGHGRADQTIQPYEFGHPETKKTQFWLKNLPLLEPTKNVKEEMEKLPEKEKHRVWWATDMNDDNRSQERSRFFPGIAEAMADQWGGYVDERT